MTTLVTWATGPQLTYQELVMSIQVLRRSVERVVYRKVSAKVYSKLICINEVQGPIVRPIDRPRFFRLGMNFDDFDSIIDVMLHQP